MKNDLVEHWMSAEPITIDEFNTLATAFHLMKLNKVRRLPVLNHDEQLVGILTWGDVREAKPKRTDHANLPQLWAAPSLTAIQDVREFMTENPLVIEPTATIRDAAEMMLINKIGGLPVMEDDELVGVITESDIFRCLLACIPEGPSPSAVRGTTCRQEREA